MEHDLAKYARKHFSFLAKEYGFVEVESSGFNYARWIRFESDTCFVSISQEFDRIFASIGPLRHIMAGPIMAYTVAGEPERQEIQYDLAFIIGFKENTFEIRNINSQMEGYEENPERAFNRHLAVLAQRIQYYCDDMLKGDFSIVPDLKDWITALGRYQLAHQAPSPGIEATAAIAKANDLLKEGKVFPSLACKYFDFLVTDYGFSYGHVDSNSVRWQSPVPSPYTWSTWVLISYTTSEINSYLDIRLGLLTIPPGNRFWYGLASIARYKDGHDVSLYHPRPVGWFHTHEPNEQDLAHLPALLRHYCDDVLRGDFSILPALDQLLSTS